TGSDDQDREHRLQEEQLTGADPMAEQPQAEPRPFSLVQGGLWYRLERRFRLVRVPPPDPAFRMWAGVVVTFLPLAVRGAVQGVLYGHAVQLPLVLDLTVYARFLVGMPLLVSSERVIDSRLALAVWHFRTSELVGERAREDLEAAIASLERARDSVIPESL